MANVDCDEIDSQIIAENVSFLDNCFNNSFNLMKSLNEIKGYIAEERNFKNDKIISNKLNKSAKLNSLDCSIYNADILTQCQESKNDFKKYLKNWGLPIEIVTKYEQKGIQEMFQWQVDCLSNPKVLLNCSNLVYSAPTSAGKTLVAEILTIKTVLERQKKVIIILPFVSIVREKMFYLQHILSSSGIRVEGFMGSQSPPGGLQSVHIAICTIEKANSLVNKLLDENSISELGAIIVDELHLLGDSHRGYILELLLTKIKYITNKMDDVQIQIIGMSATLPNLEVLSTWLDAELYVTDFRPIPLDEFCLIGNKYYDKNGKFTSNIKRISENEDSDYVLNICLETIKEGCSILIFCMTKTRCENLAQSIASSFLKLGCSGNEVGSFLRDQLKTDNIAEVLEQLKNCPVGLDQVLKNVVSFGVAYHHAGLTFDERDIIEGGFKSGAIRVLVATSTLSSGVNLPARKVIIRSPVFQRQPINILTYKQMVGRAGRMGKDTKGESILVCTQVEQKIGFDLMMGALDPVKSCIETEDKFMRAVIEMIASQAVCTKSELDLYSKCTLLFRQSISSSQDSLLENTLKQLIDFELVRIQMNGSEERYVATSLGKACLSSSMAPNDGLSLFCELQKARQCIVLETDLHLIYLVTPYSVSSQWADLDWLHLLTLWESLTVAMKKVGELIGVQESFIIRCLRGANKSACKNKLNIHKRFYTALALQDLVNEVPLSDVATKFQCARGFLQGLQQAAATFAGMVTAFCRQLGWKNMELLVSQFQDRLHFGVHSDLLDLMKLSSLNGVRARTLFDAGFETISSIASADVNVIENALYKAVPFQSEKGREGDDLADVRKRNKIRNIWITGFCGMTAKEAAEKLIQEARKYVELEIGVAEIKWENKSSAENGCADDDMQLQKVNDTESESNPPKSDEKSVLCSTLEREVLVPLKSNQIALDNTSIVQIEPEKESEKGILEKNNSVQDASNIYEADINVKERTLQNHTKYLTLKLKNDTLWDSLNINDTALDNISKLPLSAKVLSPNISFGEFEQNIDSIETKNNKSYSTSVKDVSMFSSEGDNSSLFEDSLPLDLIPSTVVGKKKESVQNEINTQYINSSSILEAFKTSVIDEDDNMKLVYDADAVEKTDFDKVKKEILTCIPDDIDEISTQAVTESWVHKDFISPLKRANKSIKNTSQPQAKRKKHSRSISNIKTISNTKHFQMKSIKSSNLKMKVNNNIIDCYILRENDVVLNLGILDTIDSASFISINYEPINCANRIGTNILEDKSVRSSRLRTFNSKSPTHGICLYFRPAICIFLDLSSLNNLKEFTNKLMKILMRSTLKLRSMSVKTHYLYLMKLLGYFSQTFSDVFVAEWLMDNKEEMSNLRELTKKYRDIDLLKTNITVDGSTKNYNELDKIEEACLKSWSLFNIADEQDKCFFDKYQFAKSVIDLENHVLKILAYSEYQGIMVDKELASRLLVDVRNSQEILQKKAYKICGYHFNFNSSKDVAKVLGIYKGRKVSTKKSVLTAHNSQMASIVIYWRKLNSILTKTLYPLTEKAYMYSSDNKINPSYTMFTCTGRISMHEPNLQNVPRTFSIPMKYLKVVDDFEPCDEVAEFNCRNIFKASPGFVFVSADYCQLEMRILTHYSKDAVLSRIMKSDVDVFKSIAASWGGVPENQVDDDLRQKAKQLCYGILYGMGNRTLSQHLDVSEMEAAVFMDSFYKTYPDVRKFTQNVVQECRSNGYVETLMKRRRYLPDINSLVVYKRNTAERQAVNTTIQGSAADIAKAAMCAIDNKTNRDTKPHLVLQMHDELIYEVIEHKKKDFIKVLKEVMETTVRLNVPLPVKVKAGYTWGALEEVKL
ncbi:DNA polymerase theta-like [Colias croceus]|uniref:DNA polymerase theta-like n=1 Tax=Colias crocea TaxID=72248 RepID=UPI001E279F15|nr:DNA polymerase theta-like [Colias croceus]